MFLTMVSVQTLQQRKNPFTQSPLLIIHPLLVPHLVNCLEGERRVNLQFARLTPLQPSSPSFFRVLASSHLSKTLPWTVTERKRNPRIMRAFMLTEKSNVQTDQGEPDLLFNIFSLPSYLTGLVAPPSETCGKQKELFGPHTCKVFLLIFEEIYSDIVRINLHKIMK